MANHVSICKASWFFLSRSILLLVVDSWPLINLSADLTISSESVNILVLDGSFFIRVSRLGHKMLILNQSRLLIIWTAGDWRNDLDYVHITRLLFHQHKPLLGSNSFLLINCWGAAVADVLLRLLPASLHWKMILFPSSDWRMTGRSVNVGFTPPLGMAASSPNTMASSILQTYGESEVTVCQNTEIFAAPTEFYEILEGKITSSSWNATKKPLPVRVWSVAREKRRRSLPFNMSFFEIQIFCHLWRRHVTHSSVRLDRSMVLCKYRAKN